MYALRNAGGTLEGTLARVSFVVSNQLEDEADLGKGEREIGTYVLPVPWQLMRHPVRVIESNKLKVVWVRNLK